MSSLTLLQIVAPLCFVFATRIKMYITNLIGYVVIVITCLFLVAYNFINNWQDFHFTTLAILLLWIVFYNTYKNLKKRRRKNNESI